MLQELKLLYKTYYGLPVLTWVLVEGLRAPSPHKQPSKRFNSKLTVTNRSQLIYTFANSRPFFVNHILLEF